MNVYDSSRIADILYESGYKLSESIDKADILIFNTCSIREKADEKLFSDLGRANLLKLEAHSKGNDCIIIVCGCVAQLKSIELINRAPYVDAVIGPQEIHKIKSVINDISTNKDKSSVILTNLSSREKFHHLTKQFFSRNCSDFLTIQEGCNNFCTYCVVPYTRGREFSRSVNDIIEEAKGLISAGVKEITLLGQNVNSYNGEGPDGREWTLAKLLFKLAELEGLARIRYVTSNPKDINADIARSHKEIDILMPFLHLPVQSGSDKILKKMNRKYSIDDYLRCIDMLRNNRPDIAFSSDFIVGFPGETDEDFENTLKLAGKVRFAQAYSFKYSPRPNTAAAKMEGQISDKIKSERLKILQNLLNDHQNQFNENSIGKYLSVLITKKGRYKNQFVGRSEYSQAVSICDNDIKIGDVVQVKITELKTHSLMGVIQQ